MGGKAWQLARLGQAGLPVPAAFVVTTDAFHAQFPRAAPAQRPRPPEVSPELVEAVGQALSRHLRSERYLAVRSSALDEDGSDDSYAGQHETYYYVTPDEVPRAIRDCWMSLWSAPARKYRALRGDGAFAMGVIVQRMVRADRSGVCFTVDPTGRFPELAWIEATWGLGAALVDGRVSPDRLLLDRDGRVRHHHVGRKRQRVVTLPGRPRDARLEPVPLLLQSREVLSDGDAVAVLALALQAERLCGSPRDVEWAYEGERLLMLQSRAVTGRATSVSAEPVPAGRWVLFKPLIENFTEPLTPMTADLFRRVLPPIGTFYQGCYYLDLDTVDRLCPFRWSEAELADALLLRGAVPPLAVRWTRLPLALLGGALLYLLDGPSWHRTAHLTRDSLAVFAALCAHLRAAPQTNALATLQRLVLGRHPAEPIGRRAYYVNVSAGRYFVLLGVLKKLLARWRVAVDPVLLGRLCSGDGETSSRRLVEAVRGLAEVARRDPALRRRLSANDPEDLAAALTGLDPEHPFARDLADVLEDFGHRCLREMELATPRWREDPLPLLLMVRGYLRGAPAPAADPSTLLRQADQELQRVLPPGWRRRLVDHLLRRIRYYVSLREDTRHYHAMAMDVTRDKLLTLEQRLIADGRLQLGGDLFYLTWDEALALRSGELEAREAAGRIRQRRRRRARLARSGPEQTLGLTPRPARAGAADLQRPVLTGQCASPGTAEGRVRIVLDPSSANDIEPGDILVAPYTDPAWTPLFPLVGAVVVAIGSFLSHAGTVAREYGIPCLVEVDACTTRLLEGQRVRVRATEGLLEVLA